MEVPELVFVVGPNAAGKSSFIRTRINELTNCEIIMTDVYKSRSKEVFAKALAQKKDIVLETVFNDASFSTLIDDARNAGYHTSLIVLFLDSIQHSIERVAFRSIEQSGLMISGGNIKLNFNESFKNVAHYFLYFDQADFIYTGITSTNKHIMSFNKSILTSFTATELLYPQQFAKYAFKNDRLGEEGYFLITINKDFQRPKPENKVEEVPQERRNLKIK